MKTVSNQVMLHSHRLLNTRDFPSSSDNFRCGSEGKKITMRVLQKCKTGVEVFNSFQ